jgi:hypothetical protein
MPNRLAAILALIAFAMCLVIGGIQMGNPLASTLWRALLAMFGTYVVGLAVGAVAKRMLDENIAVEKEKLEKSAKAQGESDR